MKSFNYLCFLALVCVAGCTSPEKRHEQDMREFYRARAEQSGVQFLRSLPITVVLLPAEQYVEFGNYREATKFLLNRHPVANMEALDFWTPSIEMVRDGWFKQENDPLSPLSKYRWKSGKTKLACQVFGVKIRGERMLLYNFVPEQRFNRPQFYSSPDCSFHANWPTRGTALFRLKDDSISWMIKQ